jgi:hypothetical protein
MADKVLEEKDEDLEIVEVDANGKPVGQTEEALKAEAAASEPEADDADDDEDEGDERLAASQDDTDDEVVSANRKRRLKRREVRKRARENAERELRLLRDQNDLMARRLAALEGNVLTQNSATIDQRLADVAREAQQAEMILAKAIKAGNGDDAAAALRIRDEAKLRIQQLDQARNYVAQAKAQAAAPKVDTRVSSLAQEWVAANPWYDPKGGDEDSRITRAIDDGLVREGYDPKNVDYWHELTRRVSTRLNTTSKQRGDDTEEVAETPRRKAPPTGNTREHVPPSTKREAFVTQERKQAMIDAGVWDDPVLRQRYVKAYQAYDKSSAR